MLRKIYLYGHLAEQFGEVWELDVASVREAIHAINVNTKRKFREAIRRMSIAIFRSEDLMEGESIDESMLDIHYKTGDFHICPAGYGGGPLAIVYGVILAASLVIAIFGNKIFPHNAPNDRDGNLDQDTSNIFGGILNSANQGQVIPLIYGEVYVGSIVISQGMRTFEVP